MAIEGGEVLGEEPPLPLAVAACGDHEHVVAKSFAESIDRTGHVDDIEQNKNIVKCEHDHETLQALVFKGFRALEGFCQALKCVR